ncbi:MAG TPA: hypothetical protein VGR03_15545 [Candidatus Acidoferrum sp.]|nr:hypothetical protein [Candidatus Acidoferrum sp.]
MRVYTKVVMDMVSNEIIEQEFYEYDGPVAQCAVDSNTFLADMKYVYGAMTDQISTLPALMNLFGDGSKVGKPINLIGIRGYVFGARMQPNWNIGFRKEGTTGVGSAGNQGLANSTVLLKYDYDPQLITGQAENLSKGEARAFMQAKALTSKYDLLDMVSHANVLVAGADRGGQLGTVNASAAGSITVPALSPTSAAALYLRLGQPIDCGPVGGGALSLQGAVISAINYATGVITHNGGTATVGHAIYLSGEAPLVAGDFPLTCEGLISLISDTGAIQGLNPATAGQQAWASFAFDNANVQITSQGIQQLRQFTKNRGGVDVDTFIFPSAQVNQLVAIATSTIRFDLNAASARGSATKRAIDLGFNVFEYAGLEIIEDKDARPDRIFAFAVETLKKFEALPLSLAEDEAGTWTRVSGVNGIADAVQALLRWYFNVGIMRRSLAGVMRNCLVPTTFLTAPPTF